MRLTRKRAKELSIEKWEILYNHPKLHDYNYESYLEENHPKLWNVIKNHNSDCSLCELYYNTGVNEYCNLECPLMLDVRGCLSKNAYWRKWAWARTPKTRKKYAGLILQIIKDWKV